VAIFSFLFSLLYPQSLKILMFMAITGTIWLGGSVAVIVGGLYWKKGRTAGAYTALAVGAIAGVFGLVYPQIYQSQFHKNFPINGQWLSFLAMITATLAYIIVSLCTCKGSVFDIEKLLHRGEHAQAGEELVENKTSVWQRLIGITEEFSKGDKIVAITLVIWNLGWFASFLAVTIMNLIRPFGNVWWAALWHTYVWLYLLISVPTTVWFTVGGIKDIKALFYLLEHTVRDHSDDGSVRHRTESEKVAELSEADIRS
jgi:SSS family solute:Na+ symporter